MKDLTNEEILVVSGGEGLFYYVGYSIGSGIRGLNQFGSLLGSEVYDLTHNIP